LLFLFKNISEKQSDKVKVVFNYTVTTFDAKNKYLQ